MELQTLKATKRTEVGSGAVRKLRAKGLVPATLYGGKKDAANITFDRREFEALQRNHLGEHAVLNLEFEDSSLNSPALLKVIERHPLRGTITHMDLQRVRLDERIQTTVPIEILGQPKGVVEGGVLDHQLRDVEIECLALDIPQSIQLDVRELGMDESLHVSDLVAPENVTLVTDQERAVVAVHPPRAAAAATEEEGEAAEGEAAEGEAAAEDSEGE